jgi:DNA-directed RNA polymerase specialized sigma24 family protein
MSPGQRTMIENNIGVIRKVVLQYVQHWNAIDDSWQFAVACHAVCEAVSANKWSPERGKFSTFVYNVAKFAIIGEWKRLQVRQRQFPMTEGEFDVEIEVPLRLVLDVPYESVFQNGFDPKLKPDIAMFKRHIEGESISDIVKELGISRQTFYNRTKPVKEALAKHVVPIK